MDGTAGTRTAIWLALWALKYDFAQAIKQWSYLPSNNGRSTRARVMLLAGLWIAIYIQKHDDGPEHRKGAVQMRFAPEAMYELRVEGYNEGGTTYTHDDFMQGVEHDVAFWPKARRRGGGQYLEGW
ncbi:hypothetical protein FB451DRAFT_1166325 [Mycena latifolia]|nr:hypothetical protein FB451DRAFT_1166325 [Mycena latifolia]